MKCGNCDGKGTHPNNSTSWWSRLIWKARKCYFCDGTGELTEPQAAFYTVILAEIHEGVIKRLGCIPWKMRYPVHITPKFRKGGAK